MAFRHQGSYRKALDFPKIMALNFRPWGAEKLRTKPGRLCPAVFWFRVAGFQAVRFQACRLRVLSF